MAGTESHYSSYNYIFNLNTGKYFSLLHQVYLQAPFYNGIAVTGLGYLIYSDDLEDKSTMERAFNEGCCKSLSQSKCNCAIMPEGDKNEGKEELSGMDNLR